MSNPILRTVPDRLKILVGSQLRNFQLYRLEREAYHAFKSKARNKRIKLMIFAQGRTGSTVLESLISSNEVFWPLHEVISKANTAWKKKLDSPNEYLEGLSRLHADKNIVCHVKVNHLVEHQMIDPRAFFEQLSEDWHIIYLYRENIVLHALSTFIADARKTYHTTEEDLKLNEIHVDLRYFQKLAKGRYNDRQDELDILKDRERLEIKYEDGLIGRENQQKTVYRIAGFLGIDSWEATTSLQKVNNAKLEELISNYDEFMEVIRENDWEHFVDGL